MKLWTFLFVLAAAANALDMHRFLRLATSKSKRNGLDCSGKTGAIPPTTQDGGLVGKPFPKVIFGSLSKHMAPVMEVCNKESVLKDSMKTLKVKPGSKTGKTQKRGVKIVAAQCSEDDTQMFLEYKPGDKKKLLPVASVDLTKTTCTKEKFEFTVVDGRKRANSASADGVKTSVFTFLPDVSAANGDANAQQQIQDDFESYCVQAISLMTDVQKMIKGDRLSMEEHSARECDRIMDDTNRAIHWTNAAKELIVFYQTSPKAASSIGIDYNRFGTKCSIDGQASSSGAHFIQQVLEKFGVMDLQANDRTAVDFAKVVIEKCEASNAVAVLQAGVQNAVIQLEKRLQNLIFDSRKADGSLANTPLAGFDDVKIVKQDESTAAVQVADLKLKNVFGDGGKENGYAVKITSKGAEADKHGAVVEVNRILTLQRHTDPAPLAIVRYTITTEVTFTATGPVLGNPSVNLRMDQLETYPRLDDATTGQELQDRVGVLADAFALDASSAEVAAAIKASKAKYSTNNGSA